MTNQEIEKRIDELLAQMTIEEKIGQMNQSMMPTTDGEHAEALYQKIREGKVGSIIMATTATAGNDDTEKLPDDIFAKLQRSAVEGSRLGIPIIFGRDVIHGHRTVLPLPIAMAAAFNPEQIRLCYRDVAAEAAREGVQWSFAPMLDLARDPRWGRCVEGPGEDPYVGTKVAEAMVKGFQGDDLSQPDSIAACAKHYIGYGASEGGRDYHRAEISDYSIRNYYLPAFKSAVNSGVQTVMCSFNEISGQPVASSRYHLTELLKEELGFDGFIIADWCAVQQLVNQDVATDDKDAARLAINAGLDMDMVDECYVNYGVELVKEGKIPMEVVDDCVRRILRVKLRLGLFEHPYVPRYKVDTEKYRKNARDLAVETMVLLKNKDNVLPLDPTKTISLIGPFSDNRDSMLGTWSLDGRPEDVVTIAEAFNDRITKAGGRLYHESSRLFDEQITFAEHYQVETVVLCLGESRRMNGEASSLAMIEVPEEQINLAKRAKMWGKKVVALMSFGRPVAMTELEPYCDAILYTWNAGTEAGNAIADIVFGDVNPSGKLPMSMPRSTGQIPIYYNPPKSGRWVNGYYGQGENYHDCLSTPMYRFGYGMSYTTFKLDKLTLDEDTISLRDLKNGKKFKFTYELTNTGNRDGKEVIQLYIHDDLASMTRPIRELKGFDKPFVEAGKTVTGTLELGFDELAFYNKDAKFAVEPGTFSIYIGTDCYAEKCFTVTVTE